MKKSRNHLIKVLSLVFALCLLLSSCAGEVGTFTVKFAEIKTSSPTYSGDEYHKVNGAAYKTICKSGLIELLFDEKTQTVAIRDTNTDEIWSSLPSQSVTKEISSYAVEVLLSNGSETVYTLNSQDNAVNFGNVSHTTSASGISVKYALALDEATGKAETDTLTDSQIRVDITLTYTLKDGSLYVNMSMNNVVLPDGVYLEKVSLLNNFGAYEESGTDDYIFVPDGSGALIMTGVDDDTFKPVNLSVYGKDAAKESITQKSQCLVGAFGIKHNESAFLCIIESGDEIAQISANRNGDTTLNQVFASFNITDIHTEQSTKNTAKTYGFEYKNEITLCYRFLSGKSATYSGMATALRENLIRNSVLSTQTVDTESKNIPFVVSLQGVYVNIDGDYVVLSTYEQALSLMTLLKAKGVNNTYLRYKGLYKNANNASTVQHGTFAKELGSEESYEKLYEYLNSQKSSLFIDTDILSFKYKGSESAESVTGKNIKFTYGDSSFPNTNKLQSLLKMSLLESRTEDVLLASEKVNFDGFALNDIGSYLYSDYSRDFYSRTTSKISVASQISVLSTSKLIMIDTGNIYSVKNADVISQIPMTPYQNAESSAYVGIPFIQMMLHGITEYCMSGINTFDNTKTAFLKSVEYGCLPTADWYCTLYTDDLNSKYYYDNTINEIVSYYAKSNEILSELRDARMTSHYKVQDNVYCTEYNNSTKVYVNYSEQPVTVNGVTVGALDCIKIS